MKNVTTNEAFAGLPALHFPDGFPGYREEEPSRFHEAGFDAYCTGVVLAKMIHYLSSKIRLPIRDRFFFFSDFLPLELQGLDYNDSSVSSLVGHSSFDAYMNKIAIVRAQFPFVHLTGEGSFFFVSLLHADKHPRI